MRAAAAVTTLAAVNAHAAMTAVQPASTGAPLLMTQLLDVSANQQALSRDYATGFRLAFAELRRTSGLSVQLRTVELDGSPAALREAIETVKNDPGQLALIGAVGESMALASFAQARQSGLDIAHVAPWLADSRFDHDTQLCALFASREDQIRYVLKDLASMGVAELGVLYPSRRHAAALLSGTNAVVDRLRIKASTLIVPDGQSLETYAAQLPASAPFFILFMGGDVELALFTRGMSGRGLKRYVVCLADVDTGTFLQLDPGKAVPVVFTQVVPNPNSSRVPVVRAYRAALQQLFDEAPSPISLAGYLGGRYAAAVLAGVGPNPSRSRVLAAFQRRPSLDLDGWRFEFSAGGRASRFVSQTLLNTRGSLVE